jgi:hypothetical protein
MERAGFVVPARTRQCRAEGSALLTRLESLKSRNVSTGSRLILNKDARMHGEGDPMPKYFFTSSTVIRFFGMTVAASSGLRKLRERARSPWRASSRKRQPRPARRDTSRCGTRQARKSSRCRYDRAGKGSDHRRDSRLELCRRSAASILVALSTGRARKRRNPNDEHY